MNQILLVYKENDPSFLKKLEQLNTFGRYIFYYTTPLLYSTLHHISIFYYYQITWNGQLFIYNTTPTPVHLFILHPSRHTSNSNTFNYIIITKEDFRSYYSTSVNNFIYMFMVYQYKSLTIINQLYIYRSKTIIFSSFFLDPLFVLIVMNTQIYSSTGINIRGLSPEFSRRATDLQLSHAIFERKAVPYTIWK